MTDYSKTVIYKIVCSDPNVTDTYVGHTTDFKNRRKNHKSDCNNENRKDYNRLIYQTIRDNGGWSNWTMVEVEQFSCENKTEATVREKYWYEELNANLNTTCPFGIGKTAKEHKRVYKQVYTEKYQKKDENIEKRKEKMECECGSCFRIVDKSRHLTTKKHLLFISQSVV